MVYVTLQQQKHMSCIKAINGIYLGEILISFPFQELVYSTFSVLTAHNLCILIYHLVEADTEQQQTSDLQDFLLQSSDEEDVDVLELSAPQLDSEAEIMAYFNKDKTNDAQRPDEMSPKYSTASFS